MIIIITSVLMWHMTLPNYISMHSMHYYLSSVSPHAALKQYISTAGPFTTMDKTTCLYNGQ